MSTGNKISIVIVVAFLAVMCFMAGIYAPWNWLLFKTFVLNEPIKVETFTPAPTHTPTAPATFTTQATATRYQSPTPAPTRTVSPTATATKKVNPTFEPIILKGTIKKEVEVREKANAGKILGELKPGNEVVVIDGTVLGEGGPLWDEIYYPLGQEVTTGWIPFVAVQYLDDGPTVPTSTPNASSTPLASDTQPAPRCFVLVLDDYVWRVVADDQNMCKNEIRMVEGDPVFDAVNTWGGLTITKAEKEFYGKYPLGQTIYVENAGMNIIYAGTKVYFQGLVYLEQSSVKVSDARDELSFSIVTKWGSAQGTIASTGEIEIFSQAGTPTATATATPTMTPTKVPTRAAPKPVSAKIGDEWHTFSYIIIAPTYVYSSPSLKDSSATYLSYGRYVKPTAKWVNDQGTVFVFVNALNEKNEYYVSGWIPATAVKSLLPNPAEIPIVQISNE